MDHGVTNMKRYKLVRISVFFLVSALLFSWSTVLAEGIKDRIKARLPVIIELKSKGVIGENNRGYLEFVGSSKEKEDVVMAENSDRKKIYTAISRQQGTSVELVGERRAVQIAGKANPGEWLQDAREKWTKK